jgi:putative pyruvate formate lyase activating enzyme
VAAATSPAEPCYLALHRSGELAERARQARSRLAACDLCAHQCLVDRNAERGECRTGTRAVVASRHPHHGEEAPLRGWNGSGTIFFSWCNLECRFCSNHDISMQGRGAEVESSAVASMMLELEAAGCHNINFVSPSHVVPMILEAVDAAAAAGLRLPLVYNTGGYDSPDTLDLLDGVIDIYMPDMKYSDDAVAEELSGAAGYAAVNRAAVRKMHAQVGDLLTDNRGIARRGLLVRHLVLPGGLAGTAEIAKFLAAEISPDTYVNVMAQYHPAWRACERPPLDRPLSAKEYREAVAIVRSAGLERLDGEP